MLCAAWPWRGASTSRWAEETSRCVFADDEREVSSAQRDVLASSLHLSVEQSAAFRRVLRSDSIRVTVLGGSVAAGVKACGSKSVWHQIGAPVEALDYELWAGTDEARLERTRCTYTARWAEWLRQSRCQNGTCSVRFYNHALGGTTTAGALAQLPLLLQWPANATVTEGSSDSGRRSSGSSQRMLLRRDRRQSGSSADLILVDFSMNDGAIGLGSAAWAMLSTSKGGPGSWAAYEAELRQQVNMSEVPAAGATEALIRYVLTKHRRAAVLLVFSHCLSTRAHEAQR